MKYYEKLLKNEIKSPEGLAEKVKADILYGDREKKPPYLLNLFWRTVAIAVIFSAGFYANSFFFKDKPASEYQIIKFEYQSLDASHVEISGDFTDWENIKLNKTASSGKWEVDLKLKKNRRYKYIFIIDHNIQTLDQNASYQVKDGFGSKNSVLSI